MDSKQVVKQYFLDEKRLTEKVKQGKLSLEDALRAFQANSSIANQVLAIDNSLFLDSLASLITDNEKLRTELKQVKLDLDLAKQALDELTKTKVNRKTEFDIFRNRGI